VCISFIDLLTHRNIEQPRCVGEAGAAEGGWDSVEDVTVAAFYWLGLKNHFFYWPRAELEYQQPPSLSGFAHIVFSTLYQAELIRG
jgi:hypothetical protein